MLSSALLQPRSRQTLAVPALMNEVALERGDLLVEQIVGLVDQADQGVCDHGGVVMMEPSGVSRRIRLIRQIGPVLPPYLLHLPLIESPSRAVYV